MFTIRTMGGVVLLLFGSTFLWITPEFVTRGLPNTGSWWAVTRVLAPVTVLGIHRRDVGAVPDGRMVEITAMASALLGLVALIPYWVAAHQANETTPWFNVLIHALGSAGALVLLLIPSLQRWVDSHVTSA